MKVKVLDPILLTVPICKNNGGLAYSSLLTKQAIDENQKPVDRVMVHIGDWEALCDRDKLEIVGADDVISEQSRNNYEIFKQVEDLEKLESEFKFSLVCEIIRNEFDAVIDIVLYAQDMSEVRPFGKEPALYANFAKSMCEELIFPLIEVKIDEAKNVHVEWSFSHARVQGATDTMSFEVWEYERVFYIKEEYDARFIEDVF